PLSVGGLSLSICALLAAVVLFDDASGELQEDFRNRALLAGTVVVALTVLTLPFLYLEARHLWDGLIHIRVAPVILAGILAALISGWALWRRHYRLAQVAAIAQISLLLLGWGLAQYPFIIYPDITIWDAASPPATLLFVLYSLPVGGAILFPSLWLLFRVFKASRA